MDWLVDLFLKSQENTNIDNKSIGFMTHCSVLICLAHHAKGLTASHYLSLFMNGWEWENCHVFVIFSARAPGCSSGTVCGVPETDPIRPNCLRPGATWKDTRATGMPSTGFLVENHGNLMGLESQKTLSKGGEKLEGNSEENTIQVAC